MIFTFVKVVRVFFFSQTLLDRYIYLSSGAHDDTVLITTFEKKENSNYLHKSKYHSSREKMSYVKFQDSLRYIQLAIVYRITNCIY